MRSSKTSLRIACVKELQDYQSCVEIEKQIWGYTDPYDVVPFSLLSIINQSGGLVLAAYTPDRRVIGFVFGFPALKHGHWVHHSHMLAVLPEYRNTGIGWRLKQAQRRYVRRQGLDLITWTFDPLQALNAHFSIAKLGVTVSEYKVNVYGESTSVLHRGLATDRFLAEWDVDGKAPRARAALAWDARPAINETFLTSSGLRRSTEPQLRRRETHLRFEIPADIEAVKRADLALAIDWQQKVRQAFLTYFRRGYRVTGFRVTTPMAEARAFYELTGPQI